MSDDNLDDFLKDVLKEPPLPPEPTTEIVSLGEGTGMLVEHTEWPLETDEDKRRAITELNADMQIAGATLATCFTAFGLIEHALSGAEEAFEKLPRGAQRVELLNQAAELAAQALTNLEQMTHIKLSIHRVDHVPDGTPIEDVLKRARAQRAAKRKKGIDPNGTK
jgi:hypothetical protein